MRQQYPGLSPNETQAQIGHQWRALPEAEKATYKKEAARLNRNMRARLSSIDPQQLLARHEMWLQSGSNGGKPKPHKPGEAHRLVVHYLGDDAFQCLDMHAAATRPCALPARGHGPPGTHI